MRKPVALLTAFVFAGASHAQAASLSFAFHAHELSSDASRDALHDRLTTAAREFCMIESRKSLKAFRQEKACVAEIADTLVERIDDARLAALHATENGGR